MLSLAEGALNIPFPILPSSLFLSQFYLFGTYMAL
jgi:hypothetical protein